MKIRTVVLKISGRGDLLLLRSLLVYVLSHQHFQRQQCNITPFRILSINKFHVNGIYWCPGKIYYCKIIDHEVLMEYNQVME